MSAAVAKLGTIDSLLTKSRDQIAAALPRHLTPDRMIRLALTVCRSPELRRIAETDDGKISILGGVIQAAQLGLELDNVLGQAYLVPFKGKVQLIVGYKGMLSLARRSGDVSHFSAHVVHEADDLSYQYGTEPRLHHRPVLESRGDPVAVYAVIGLKDGSWDFEVIGWEEIKKCQAKYSRGKADSPWNSHTEEMARKTAIRRLFKRVPVSVEMQRAAVLDEYSEEGVDQRLDNLVDHRISRTSQVEALLASRANGHGAGEPQATREQLGKIDTLVKSLELDAALFEERCKLIGADPKSMTQAQAEELCGWLDELGEAAAIREEA